MGKWKILLIVAGLVGSPASFAKFESASDCELALNGRVALHVYRPSGGRPTFLLLPGAYRGLMSADAGVAALIEAGFGVVTFNFSVQPFSLRHQDSTAGATEFEVSLESLAAEVQSVVQYVERHHGLTQLIPVSLSYSATVSPSLKGYPLIIETVPMTSELAHNPNLATYKRWLRSTEWMLPFSGSLVTRQMLDVAYATEWHATINDMIVRHGFASSMRSQMLDGYMALTRAAEDFEWDHSALDTGTLRVFVLAEDEGKELLRHQMGTIVEMEKRGFKVATVLVEKSNHFLPIDQPALYVKALGLAAGGRLTPGSITILRAVDGHHYIVDGFSSGGSVPE